MFFFVFFFKSHYFSWFASLFTVLYMCKVCIHWIQVREHSDCPLGAGQFISTSTFSLSGMTDCLCNCKPIKMNDYFPEFCKIGIEAIVVWFGQVYESKYKWKWERGSRRETLRDLINEAERQAAKRKRAFHSTFWFEEERRHHKTRNHYQPLGCCQSAAAA